MKWDESKHPRDEIGRFTDGKSFVKELKPDVKIQMLNNLTIDELKELSIKNSFPKIRLQI